MNSLIVCAILITLCILPVTLQWGEGGWRGEGGWGPRPWGGEGGWRPRPWGGEGGWGPRPWGGEGGWRPRPWGGEGWRGKRGNVLEEMLKLKREDISKRQAECRYFSENRKLVCNGGAVECDALSKLSVIETKFEMFGIGMQENSGRFRLYPKNLTDVTYNSNLLKFSKGKSIELNLFQSEDTVSQSGIEIKEKACFEKMISFFKSVNNNLFVDIVNERNTVSKLTLLGYVLNI